MAVHLSIFINGCLSDADEWYDSVEDATQSLGDGYDYQRYDSIKSRSLPANATCHKYQLWHLDENGERGERSAYMAEITEYPSLEFCECAGDRLELDNETGIYDPEQGDCCMACEADRWEAEQQGFDAWEVTNA